jgi:hypothetical protein
VPSYDVAITSAVTDGLFISSENHGLALNQEIVLTGFTALTGYTNGSSYWVKQIPQTDQFNLSETLGGTAITGSGTVTGGSAAQTFSSQTIPLSFDATPNAVEGALSQLNSIGTNNVAVDGVVGYNFYINFINNKGFANLPQLTVTNFLIGAEGKTANVDFTSASLRDLLANNLEVNLDLEIELTDAAGISTMILTSCTVQEQLIY